MNFEAAMQDVKETGVVVMEENFLDPEPGEKSLTIRDVNVVKAIFFNKYLREIEKMAVAAGAIEIINAETQNGAVVIGGGAAKLKKAIEAQRKLEIAEAEAFTKGVNNFCKGFTGALDLIERTIKDKLATYQYNVELQRRKQEEAAKRAAKELQDRLDKEAAEANLKAKEEAKAKGEDPSLVAQIKAPEVLAPIIPKEENKVRTDTGITSYGAKRWVCDIEEGKEAQVPREYCTPSQTLLNQAVKSGVREIPGCRIYEKQDTRFRT